MKNNVSVRNNCENKRICSEKCCGYKCRDFIPVEATNGYCTTQKRKDTDYNRTYHNTLKSNLGL